MAGWSSQSNTDGTYNSSDRPAILNTGEFLFMAWKGVTGDPKLYYARNTGSAWGPLAIAQGSDGVVFQSAYAPALTMVGSMILMVWTGNDKRLRYSLYDLTTGTWSAQAVCRGSEPDDFASVTAPGLASIGGTAFLFAQSVFSNGRFWSCTFDVATRTWGERALLPGNFRTDAKPAVAEFFGSLVLAWSGHGDTSVWYSVLDPRTREWSAATLVTYAGTAFGTSDGPALLAVGTSLLLVWKGVPGDTRIWQSRGTFPPPRDVPEGSAPPPPPPPTVTWEDQTVVAGSDSVQFGTAFGPALVKTREGVVMVWRNSSNMQLWQSTFAADAAEPGRILAAESRYETANWMGQLAAQDPAFGQKGLGQMVLLGTHNAGMYSYALKSILGQTQDRTIYEQLMSGVRFFDLRVSYDVVESNEFSFRAAFRIVHGPIPGPEFLGVLIDIRNFMAKGGKEVVVLKLSHLENSQTVMRQDVYADLATRIDSVLGPWLYKDRFDGRLAAVPFATLTRSGGKVIVVVDGDYAVNKPMPGIYVYRDATLNDRATLSRGDLIVFDSYSDTTSYAAMMTDQQDKFRKYQGRCSDERTDSDMFVLSWTLTPATFVWWWASGANAKLQNEITASRIESLNPGRMINVVYLDYYEHASTDTKDVLDYAIGLMR
jgi:hypothetical protein